MNHRIESLPWWCTNHFRTRQTTKQ